MTRTTIRLTGLTGALLAGALFVTGCSGDAADEGTSDSSSVSSSDGAEADHNDQDGQFALEMAAHHEQAIEMAQAADEQAEDPRVRDLAARIEAEQQKEIDTLTGWLDEWGVESSGMGGMDHGGMDHGAGMMSEEDMTSLRDATGPEFDREFLEGMLEHHRGAVQQSEDQISDGQNAEAIALATSIRDSQTAEIEEMEQLLADLGS